MVEDQLPQAVTKRMIQRATNKDKELQLVLEDIKAGRCRNGLAQATVVHLAHEGHLGQDKTLGLLRETCWFPGMGDKVHKLVSTCRPCLAAVPGTQKEPLKPTLLPDAPWQQVHADYKGPIIKRYYLHTFIRW